VDVLFIVCSEEAKRVSITDVRFGSAMAGDVLENAMTQFFQAMADFYPKVQRDVLTASLETIHRLRDAALIEAKTSLAAQTLSDAPKNAALAN
jgi:hypothetical protein